MVGKIGSRDVRSEEDEEDEGSFSIVISCLRCGRGKRKRVGSDLCRNGWGPFKAQSPTVLARRLARSSTHPPPPLAKVLQRMRNDSKPGCLWQFHFLIFFRHGGYPKYESAVRFEEVVREF